MLGEISQTQQVIYCMIHLYEISEQANPYRHKADQWLPGAGWREKWRVIANGDRVSFWVDENDRIVAQLCEYTANHLIVHFKRVNFMYVTITVKKSKNNKSSESLIQY